MSGFQLGQIRPVETPDLGATLSRMAAIDAQRQQTALARQAFEQDQGFNRTLAAAAPGLASGQGPEYDSALASIAGAGPRGLTLALPLLQQSRDRREAADFWRQGSPSGTPSAPVQQAGGGGGLVTGASIQVPAGLDDADILARTLLGEAANQGEQGMAAVAHVVRNRMQQTGRGVRDVVLAANQFEPWGSRRQELLGIRTDDPRYIEARRIAEATLAGQGQDPTNGSTHFLNPDLQRQLGRQQPAWAPEGQGQRIGAHVFYRPGGGVVTGQGDTTPASTPASAPQAGGVNPAELALLERALQSGNPQIVQQAQRRMELLRLRMAQDAATRREQPAAPAGYRWAADGRSLERIPGGPRDPNEQTGPFAGNGMDAQANNVALRLAGKIRAGTATPAEQALYQRAYSHLAGGTIQYVVDPSDPTGLRQVAVRVPRDMGDLPAPGGGAAPGQAAPQQGVTTPTQGMTTPTQAGATADASPMPTAPNAIPGMERMTPPPAGFRRREDGTMEPIPGGPQDPNQASAGDRTRLRQIETDAQGILDALKSFRTARNDSTMLERGIAATGIPTTLSTAWTNAALLAKGEALYNLGVLSGPDLSIIQRALSDPATLRGFFTGDVTANGQIDAIETLIRQRVANARRQYGGPQAQSPGPGGVGTAEPPPAASRSAPAPGTVQDGYRFRGGDPSQQSNWERVQ